MPTTIKTPFRPLKAVVSKYITPRKAREDAQKQVKGDTAEPKGAQGDVDLATAPLAKPRSHILADDGIPAVQVDEQGRTLGLEDPSDPALIDDTTLTVLRITTSVPTTTVTDPTLISTVTTLTNGSQTCIPYFPPPPSTSTTTISTNQYGFVDPRVYSGTSLDSAGPPGLGEPLNVILSSHSSPLLLTRSGFQSYLRSLDFDRECLGLHGGGYQTAHIDPRGDLNQDFIFRQIYTPLDHVFGTCIESLVGGNHVRAWQQQGSGAWFLATSKEEKLSKHHMIVPDGYDVGRNEVVRKAQGKGKDGRTSFMGKRYRSEVMFVAGLMKGGAEGVNHGIAVDGLTAVLTVTVEGGGWFGAKTGANAAGEATVEQQKDPAAASAVAATVSEDAPPVDTGEEHPGRRRASLAKRFSLSRAPSRQGQVELEKRSSQQVWQKLRRLSTPKHQLSAASTDAGRTTAINETGARSSSVESASTVAAAGETPKLAMVDATRSSGLVVAAPAMAA
ncbi:hypothetical protein PSEUBRA_006137 [Kalmanozyma brasiliensis GHG001]|uniref:Uncharacterized protein n=1 Tax=Kalmanozyma brasiliensis (strain GHG001) TaxID=1365824 RepID=V5EJB1_KALBG|nr:uncharacterized protein PSEUBRA_006137 [Kalmanozyma brasiliensis GHG001]EST04830.1 hypothetical protein PSEUBRA_006137 [Kalmanozyma brasiliensis GHG001]